MRRTREEQRVYSYCSNLYIHSYVTVIQKMWQRQLYWSLSVHTYQDVSELEACLQHLELSLSVPYGGVGGGEAEEGLEMPSSPLLV